uniref:Uncharacterized protein n=1 Tax=Arundo donax TaxID=35708 RepID=A0A0A9B7G8_ARUDO
MVAISLAAGRHLPAGDQQTPNQEEPWRASFI